MSRDDASGGGEFDEYIDVPGRGGGDGPPWRLLGVAAVVVAVAAWVVRPWLHDLIYGLYTTPLLAVAPVIGAVAGWLYGAYGGDAVAYAAGREEAVRMTPGRVAVVVAVLVATVVVPVAGVVAEATMSDQTMATAERVDALDDADPDNPRIVTRAVAARYAANTLNRPQYRAGDTDISVVNGTPYWAAPLAPDGVFNVLTKEQAGTVLVDMTTQQANVRTVDGRMEEGVGTIFFENYRWHLLKTGRYLADYGDPKMVVHGGEQYIAVPYSVPEFHLTPLPHTTPRWGGVALIDAAGDVEMLSPEAAAAHPVLDDQQLYPEDLARKRVAATKYRNGVLNTFTSHEGQIEVAPVPGENNDQPFFVLTEEGPQYVVAVEPYGDAQGLREVWSIDGQTGAFEVYRPEQSLFGPSKAADLVRQSSPQTDWNRFSPAEPILTVVEDEEYWQVRVVPEDNSGIAYVAFVNAQTSDVHEFSDDAAIRRFIAGGSPPNRTGGGSGGGDDAGDGSGGATGSDPAVIVQRVDENGTVVETMVVYGNESVRVRPAENGSVTPGASAVATANATATPAP